MILQTNKERCELCDGDGIRRCECGGIVVKKEHLMDGKIGTHFECYRCEEWYSDDECHCCDGIGHIKL